MYEMRKIMILLMPVLMILTLSLSACNEERITDPTEADWSVNFVKVQDGEGYSTQSITVMWVGESSEYDEPASLSVEIDGETVDMDAWGTYWFGQADLVPGEHYNVKLVVDGSVKCNTEFSMVRNAYAYFPASYDPAFPVYVSWALNGNNQIQMASLRSMDNADLDTDVFDHKLSPSARSFTFPAYAVQDFGYMTTYTLDIVQMNSKTVNDIMFVSSSSQYQDYGYGTDYGINKRMLIQYCIHLINHLG
jgi:hypothetical protein